MSPRFVLGRENVPCDAEVVKRSLKADCTDFTMAGYNLAIIGAGCLNLLWAYVLHCLCERSIKN